MVSKLINVTSLTGEGLRDWLVQRVTSVILGGYLIFLLGYLLTTGSQLDYFSWQALFSNNWMRVFSILFLLSLFMHAWVGIWTVITDYLKAAWLRLLVQVTVILMLIVYLIWGVSILWSA